MQNGNEQNPPATNSASPPASGMSRWQMCAGVAGILALGAGWAMARTALTQEEHPFVAVPKLASIDAGLEQSGQADLLVHVTRGDGKIDILFVGAPECVHCQAFMNENFDALVEIAKTRHLDFAYAPTASTPLGLSIAALERCAAPSSGLSAPERVAAGYAAIEPLWKIVEKAQTEEADGAAALLSLGIGATYAAFAPTQPLDQACYGRETQGLASRMQTLSEVFEVEGTPSFFVRGPGGTVLKMTGLRDFEGLVDLARE